MKKIIFFSLLISLFVLTGCLKTAPKQNLSPIKTTDKQYYETADLKIPLPAPMFVKDENSAITLFHTVETFSHTDFCDFKGDSLPTTTLRDFTVKFSFTTLSMEKAILKFGGDYLKEYINTDGSIKESEGFLEKTKIGDREGYKLTQGVEGCGYDQYYFQTENGVLIVQKNFVPELTSLCTQSEQYKTANGIILPEKAQQLFEELVKNTIIK